MGFGGRRVCVVGFESRFGCEISVHQVFGYLGEIVKESCCE